MKGILDAVPALAVVYKSTHFNPDTNEWITPESEIIHVCVSSTLFLLLFAKL